MGLVIPQWLGDLRFLLSSVNKAVFSHHSVGVVSLLTHRSLVLCSPVPSLLFWTVVSAEMSYSVFVVYYQCAKRSFITMVSTTSVVIRIVVLHQNCCCVCALSETQAFDHLNHFQNGLSVFNPFHFLLHLYAWDLCSWSSLPFSQWIVHLQSLLFSPSFFSFLALHAWFILVCSSICLWTSLPFCCTMVCSFAVPNKRHFACTECTG